MSSTNANKKVYRVLIVNDSSADVKLTREALAEFKCNIVLDFAMDETEAKNYLQRCSSSTSTSGKPDLIIIDLNLPGKDGRQILEFIKIDNNLGKIPVVLLVNSSNNSDIHYCYEKGANCYIVKPVDYNSFTLTIKGICSFWLKCSGEKKGSRLD